MRLILRIVFTAFATFMALAGQVNAVDLLYSTMDNGSIVTYDISLTSASAVQNSSRVFSSGVYTESGLAFDSSGNLYGASYAYDRVTRFTTSGTSSTFTSGLSGPSGLAFDSSGNLYAANLFNATGNYISKISTGGSNSRFANIDSPYDLVTDSSNNLYVSSKFNSKISKITPSGSVSSFVSALGIVSGLAIDSSGYIYSSAYLGGSYKIIKINSAGSYSNFATGSFSTIKDLAIDSSNNLSVSDDNGTISKFDSSGNFQFTWSTGSTKPRFLTVSQSAVPEPSTYALGLIASGALAAIAKRRKARQIINA